MGNKEKNKITVCKVCGNDVARGAKHCPSCGKDQRNFFMKHKIISFVLVLFIFGGIGGAIGGDNSSVGDTPTTNEENSSEKDIVAVDKKEEPAAEVKKEDNVPIEYKSALTKAKIYSDNMAMSKSKIYDQLTSEYGEKFTKEAAQYAIDNLEADWNANALKKAKTYQESMAMSPSKIYDQLVSDYGEKFTAEEAQYAIDNLEK